MPTIRKANLGDAKELAEVAEVTFRATFGTMNTSEHMERHCKTSYAEQIQAVEIASPGMVTLVSEEKGGIVGYAQIRWGSAPGCVSAHDPGEIQRLYVVEAWHGKGVAQELMHVCINEMRQHGSDVVWLGVWEHNPRAIAFYKKSGFVEVGSHTFPLGGDPQRDIVMVKRLTPKQHI